MENYALAGRELTLGFSGGIQNELVLESLFGAFWRPLLGPALENSLLQVDPNKIQKGSKMRTPFLHIF